MVTIPQAAPGANLGDFGARRIDQAGADQDRIGAPFKRHFDPAQRQNGLPFVQRLGKLSEHGVDDQIMRAVDRFDGEIGERVSRRALLKQAAKRRFGIGGLEKRPVRLLAHAGEQNVETGLEPDRDAARGDIVARRSIHERAPACRQNHRTVVEKPSDHLALALAKIGLAEPLENFRDRQLRPGLDFGVSVDEAKPKLRRKALADRGLPGAHHADQHHGLAAKRGRHTSGVDRLTLTHAP